MIKKTITFKDMFTDEEKTKDFYFNLTGAEISRMINNEGWDFRDRIMAIVKERDTAKIIRILEEIVLRAYGEKTSDGYFLKKRPDGTLLADMFVTSPAYDVLYFELIQDPTKFADFINALVPADMAEQVKEAQASGKLPPELEGMM